MGTALFLNGLTLGAAYALVAIGFVLTLNATNAVNFAHGDLVMAGGVLGSVMAAPWLAAIFPGAPGLALVPLVMVVTAALGAALSLIGHRPIADRPPVAVFITTIAFGIILRNGALLTAGPEPRSAPPLIEGPPLALAGVSLDRQGATTLALCLSLIGLCHWVLARTQFGRRLRAAAQDAEMARACGLPVAALSTWAFVAASALAGVAGLALANLYLVTPMAGGDLMLKAYIAVTVGGWGSIPGAVAGAFLIALFEVGVGAVFSQPVAMGGLFVAALSIVVWRPTGLFGEAARRRA